ncbi:MAG: Uma2 family endonuclease [Candidatus Polarisedimenticolaceae bacterium]|nr:Uma2 family endonuclease [Candidatus Polarisedimenticolaceae bacterium]
MVEGLPTQPLSHDDYFALEQEQDQRFEYIAGEVFAMTGGTERHAMISSNALVALSNGLRGKPCRVYGSDMKLHIAEHDKFCYPDVMVLCEEGRRSKLYVEEPLCIVEVLSDSTESYDRGLKFEHYRSIPSLQSYLLLNQDRPHAELFERDTNSTWHLAEASGREMEITITSMEIPLALSDLYQQVDFDSD